ncbi:unnamed protein product [Acanthoscelides obtectus]|uniref:Uncharacterized protein n=1 Tax=Acanthoscelides obtectus TaxID=200917 RepID=A0A9P0LD95_ACAOB|nr:unnamed protein product [Acanthoscelides obtectus]CAK1662272.1 Protein stoned-A [Acanthoscelides obtectus]
MKSGRSVDDILKKTQGDLDRIRSTSFFQRKPTEVEIEQAKQEHIRQQQQAAQEARTEAAAVSESESEEEEDDDIFDTAYIEAVATGEIKLANIPESPTELTADGDDPFDTSIADRAILGPQVSIKGKRLVPLGAAVEVLTGRVELPTCATKRPVSNKRQVFKERDLLLGSFDQDTAATIAAADYEEPKKTVLDEDIDLPDVPIDLSKPIHPPAPVVKGEPEEAKDDRKDIIEEFDLIAKKEEDDDDVEFELLAVESIKKPGNVVKTIPPVIGNLPVAEVLPDEKKWNAPATGGDDADVAEIDDPFDTTFAAKVVPFEDSEPADLNFIKPEDRDLLGGSQVDLPSAANIAQIVDEDDDFDFDPRAEEKRERSVSRPEVLNISGGSKTVS